MGHQEIKYKVTLDCRTKYVMAIDAPDIGTAAKKAEKIFNEKANYNDIEQISSEAIMVEKDNW